MINIERDLTIPKINKLYQELLSNKDTVIDIQLPKKIEKSDFGVLFSFIQFFATWVRNKKSGNLYLPVNGVEDAIKYLEENEFVYPAIVLSWEKDILDAEGLNIKNELKAPSKKYFERMDFFDLKGHLSVPIFCFDHDKSNRGLSKHFYNSNRELISEGAMGFNLYRAFQKIGSFNKTIFRDSLSNSLDSFNAIIHELFGNTNEHAKTNELGYNLYPNIRAIQLKFHRKPITKYLELYQDFDGLVEYFQSDFTVNTLGEIYLLEISIVDSGPGLVKRYKGISEYDITVNEEVEVIKECLYRHNTSTSGLGAEIKGIGLDRVLQTIDGKGFLRIKSGRADLIRNMKTLRYVHHEKASDILLFDLENNSSSTFTVNPEVEGTLISIFYPLEF
ncbi:hypothetical protein BH09BAC2_BH09BAC2_13020 [soil metagenome]